MRAAFTAILVMLPGAGCRMVSQELPSDEPQIRAVLEQYADGWIRNDSTMILETVDEDVVLLPHHGDRPLVGISAARAFWWAGPAVQITRFEQTVRDVGVQGDVAWAWGAFSLRFLLPDSVGAVEHSNQGNYLAVLRRQSDDRWKITHRIWDDPRGTRRRLSSAPLHP
jgi:uncharacterized protein (TIGR02246 family)